MQASLKKCLEGYQAFRKKYHQHDDSVMSMLAAQGQQPQIMVVGCCDSRVDPAIVFQCSPGDLFVVRNVANIIPPFENDEYHHGTSAALELGVRIFKVKHLVIMGHSDCGGLQALLEKNALPNNDFIDKWMSQAKPLPGEHGEANDYAKTSLNKSYSNCLSFPWIKQAVEAGSLQIHRWFFDIKHAQIQCFEEQSNGYINLEDSKTYQSI